MKFIGQVIAIYLGFLLVLGFVGSMAALAVKYKIQPVSGQMLVAFGLLFATAGIFIWYVERQP